MPTARPYRGAQVAFRLARHDFRLGANGFLIRGGSGHRPDLSNTRLLLPAYERAFAGLLNYATLPFYWGRYEPTPGEEKVEHLRRMAEWCREHNLCVKGHPLAWHEVFPKWAGELPDETVLKRLRDRVSRLVGEFRGLVDTWDVFNEITVAPNFDNAVGRWVKARGAVACVAAASDRQLHGYPHVCAFAGKLARSCRPSRNVRAHARRPSA